MGSTPMITDPIARYDRRPFDALYSVQEEKPKLFIENIQVDNVRKGRAGSKVVSNLRYAVG